MRWILMVLLGIVIIFVGLVGGICDLVTAPFR
jgi:hypothetical protein